VFKKEEVVWESGDRVIGSSGHRKSRNLRRDRETKTLPLMTLITLIYTDQEKKSVQSVFIRGEVFCLSITAITAIPDPDFALLVGP